MQSAIDEISQIIYENYYTLGVTGSQAMQNIQEDIDAGFFEETVDGWDITYDELGLAIDAVRSKLVSENAMTREPEVGAPPRRVASLWRRLKPGDPDAGAKK